MITWLIDIKKRLGRQQPAQTERPSDVPLAGPFELAASLAVVVRNNRDGFTWSPQTRRLVTAHHEDEYCVCRHGYEKCLRRFPPEPIDLVGWVVAAYDRLRFHGEFVGGWRDSDGLYFLDVAIVVRGFGPAVKFGLANHQNCIYQLRSGKCVDLAPCRNGVVDLPDC